MLKPKILLTFNKKYSTGSKLRSQIEGVTSANLCAKKDTEIFLVGTSKIQKLI